MHEYILIAKYVFQELQKKAERKRERERGEKKERTTHFVRAKRIASSDEIMPRLASRDASFVCQSPQDRMQLSVAWSPSCRVACARSIGREASSFHETANNN